MKQNIQFIVKFVDIDNNFSPQQEKESVSLCDSSFELSVQYIRLVDVKDCDPSSIASHIIAKVGLAEKSRRGRLSHADQSPETKIFAIQISLSSTWKP